jgi:flagellar biosynthetic protein FlhB
MAADGAGGGEKTEKPTPRKLKEARKEGQVARSSDLGAWLGIGAAALLLPMMIRNGLDAMTGHLLDVREIAQAPEEAAAVAALGDGLKAAAKVVAPLAAVAVAVAIGASASQGGIRLATKAARPQIKRLNPAKGIKRLFGPQTLWEACKTLLKTTVVALVLLQTVKSVMPSLVGSGALPLGATIDVVRDGTAGMIRAAVMAGLVLAAADYLVARRRTMKQLRMSRKEVTEEHKQTEGDPLLKGAIRSRQIAMSRNRMMSEVAKADVVLVNPTHVAVALRYDPDKGAPRVVAKGAGTIAAKIRERAGENRVPMVEDVPLARTLHRTCELGQEIPAELYSAVARVLAFVMRLRGSGVGGGLHRFSASDHSVMSRSK